MKKYKKKDCRPVRKCAGRFFVVKYVTRNIFILKFKKYVTNNNVIHIF